MNSETSVTSSPASRSAAAVPPVERISTPSAGEALGEVGDPGLVGDRDQRPPHPDRAVAHGLCAGVCGGLSSSTTTTRGSLASILTRPRAIMRIASG